MIKTKSKLACIEIRNALILKILMEVTAVSWERRWLSLENRRYPTVSLTGGINVDVCCKVIVQCILEWYSLGCTSNCSIVGNISTLRAFPTVIEYIPCILFTMMHDEEHIHSIDIPCLDSGVYIFLKKGGGAE